MIKPKNITLTRLYLLVLVLVTVVSCQNNTKNKLTESVEQKTIESNNVLNDTTITSFPMGIGNNSGSVKIEAQKEYKNEQLTNSNFVISLEGFSNYSLSKQINKNVLIDLTNTNLFKDTLNTDYLDLAIIKDIEYRSVRSNMFYFNAILENPHEKKSSKEGLAYFSVQRKKECFLDG